MCVIVFFFNLPTGSDDMRTVICRVLPSVRSSVCIIWSIKYYYYFIYLFNFFSSFFILPWQTTTIGILFPITGNLYICDGFFNTYCARIYNDHGTTTRARGVHEYIIISSSILVLLQPCCSSLALETTRSRGKVRAAILWGCGPNPGPEV